MTPAAPTSPRRTVLAAKPSVTQREIDYVTDAVTNGWGTACYDYLNRFSDALRAFFGVPHVWPTSSCHGALHIALKALGIGPGDEVIVPDLTWTGSVFPVSWLGATPVCVDSLATSWCIDPEAIAAAITPQTRAIIVVHLYGNLCDMDAIMAIGRQHNIPVIEDAAEAVGSEYHDRPAGAIADMGVFSMHGTKTLTTGEGGVLLCNREAYVEAINTIESQGRKPGKHIMFWVDEIGLKYKMSNIQAALGLGQVERAAELIDAKRRVFDWYRSVLMEWPDIALNPEPSGCRNSYWQPTVMFGASWAMNEARRNALVTAVNAAGVNIRPVFYPVSKLPMYDACPHNRVAYDLHGRGINLPSYFDMTRDDADYVLQILHGKLTSAE
ncbi:MAG: DegT/DnrJ/EryC1/StrS family aminotransferase [Verrucomicrobia bacterium]|jgi:perosamine synthetase|nr:DegT/DnrJ/EryC1/StrS family aminotransferase [Verrucomicrobiota bacterium]MBT7066317.1 DegT/DnrJ/EryC1/StrS family aminotransferase [Verrucomicrobiota bacterium]MBT7699275.1 DegT/DnrJ/EryC1/StrS family aminotransferase [Verrucomicrobiota bacterium]